MDFTRAITYVFRERDWIKKILITGLISIIPIVGFIYLSGWITETVRRVQRNDYEKLPPKAEFRFFTDGLKILVAILIYCIPLILFVALISLMRWIWATLFGGVIETIGVEFFTLIRNVANFLYFFLMLYILPLILDRFILTRTIQGTFDFKGVYLTVRSNPKPYFALLLACIITIIIASIGISLFYVGIIFTIPYGAAIYAHLVGDHN